MRVYREPELSLAFNVGDKVQTEEGDIILVTTGSYKGRDDLFSGTVIQTNGQYTLGYHSDVWIKIKMKPLIGTERIVHPSEMNDGEIGVIVEWDSLGNHIGTVVQMVIKDLICIGKHRNSGWSGAKDWSVDDETKNCKIKILPPGTLLEI